MSEDIKHVKSSQFHWGLSSLAQVYFQHDCVDGSEDCVLLSQPDKLTLI